MSAREHLENVAKQTGEVPAELAEAVLPAGTETWWGWFIELNDTRGVGAAGPEPVRYSEVESWARLTGRELTPSEVRLLKQIDQLYMEEWARQNKRS